MFVFLFCVFSSALLAQDTAQGDDFDPFGYPDCVGLCDPHNVSWARSRITSFAVKGLFDEELEVRYDNEQGILSPEEKAYRVSYKMTLLFIMEMKSLENGAESPIEIFYDEISLSGVSALQKKRAGLLDYIPTYRRHESDIESFEPVPLEDFIVLIHRRMGDFVDKYAPTHSVWSIEMADLEVSIQLQESDASFLSSFMDNLRIIRSPWEDESPDPFKTIASARFYYGIDTPVFCQAPVLGLSACFSNSLSAPEIIK